MRIEHKGAVVELDDADNRVPVIALLLMSGPLGTGAVTRPAPRSPKLEAYWSTLTASQKRELMLLAERPRPPHELETMIGLSGLQLRGQHATMNHLARKSGLRLELLAKGRGRQARRFFIAEEFVEDVAALAKSEGISTEPVPKRAAPRTMAPRPRPKVVRPGK